METQFENEIANIEKLLISQDKSNQILGLLLISENNDFIDYFIEEFIKNLQYCKFTNNYKYKIINDSEPLFYEDFTKVIISILDCPLVIRECYCRGSSYFVEDNGVKLKLIPNYDEWTYELEDNKRAFDILKSKISDFLYNKLFLNQINDK